MNYELKKNEDNYILHFLGQCTKRCSRICNVKRSGRCQILGEVADYIVYCKINNTIKASFQVKRAVSKKKKKSDHLDISICTDIDDGRTRCITDN